MLRSSAFVVACALIPLSTVVARAQVETTPIPMSPKPNFSSMQFQLGTWNCTTTNTRRAVPYTDTSKAVMDPSGYWMVTTDVTHPVSYDPHAHTTVTKVTYDASTSRWVSVSTDDGGGYDMSTSNGWEGNTMVWHDVAFPKTASITSSGDTTITKVSNTKTTLTSSFTESSGRVVHVKGTCTKSSG
jgi:hypothetical protein